jgi:hypothetical protein
MSVKREVVGGSGKAQLPSRFGEGAREVSGAMAGRGAPSKGSGGGGMKIKIPSHPDKSRVK